jgi:CDGSH-type Zn-finger protein
MSRVVIKASENGPYLVEVDGKIVAALCRCGGSTKKPNCDGTHRKAGFTAAAAEVKVAE